MSMELIDKNKIKYLSIPIAPVLVGEDVHYEIGALKEWIDDMPTVKAIPLERVEQIKQEVKEWYWNHDIQYLAKDPCVVDAMTDMFIRMLDKAIKEQNE